MGNRFSAESSSSRGSDGERRSSDASKYAVFVAHHRAAAGSDARFLHAQLERALGARCFLGGRDDGSDDGIRASAEGLARSRTLLLVQTAGVLSVPSVLLECYDAVTRGLPLVCVRLISEDVDAYDFDDARDLLEDLPNELPRRVGADALAALEAGAARLGTDVPTVASTLAATLPQLISCELDPAGTDNQVNAALRDIVDRLKKQIHHQKKAQRTAAAGGGGGDDEAGREHSCTASDGAPSARTGSSALPSPGRPGGGMVELAIDVAPPSYAGGDAPVAPPAGPPPRPWTQVSGAGSRRRLSVGAVQFEIDDELSVAHEMSCTPRGVHVDL